MISSGVTTLPMLLDIRIQRQTVSSFIYPRVAAPTGPLLHLLVGKAGLAGRAPVDGCDGAVRETPLVEQEEDPLRPAVVVRATRIDLASPVVAAPCLLQGPLVARRVFGNHFARVTPTLDCLVFRGLSESVPAHRVQDAEAVHALEPAERVHGHVVAKVADVQTGARWIREHLETVDAAVLGIPRVFGGAEGVARKVPDAAQYSCRLLSMVLKS